MDGFGEKLESNSNRCLSNNSKSELSLIESIILLKHTRMKFCKQLVIVIHQLFLKHLRPVV